MNISGDSFLVTAATHPLKVERRILPMPEGYSVQKMLTTLQPDSELIKDCVVFINGDIIPREYWGHCYPKAGTHLEVRAFPVPMGGGGNKGFLRILLTLAVIVASFYFPGLAGLTGIAAQTATALIGFTGLLLVNALVPVKPLDVGSGGESIENKYFLEGSRNQATPFAPIPVILGRHRVVPPLGARTFTEIIGEDQYLRMLVVWGIGPLNIETDSIKIGETDVTEFDGVEIEHRQGYSSDTPLTLFPGQVSQQDLSLLLTSDSVWFQQTSVDDADELSLDFSFPAGLVNVDNRSGGYGVATVTIEIEFRKVGDVTWNLIDSTASGFETTANEFLNVDVGGDIIDISFMSNKAASFRHGIRWPTGERAQYDVRVRRTNFSDPEDNTLSDDIYWSAIRTITNEDPIDSIVPVAKTALRIKATDQLNSVVDTLNGIVQSIAPDWNGATWPESVTSNPASLFRLVLQGAGNANPLLDARLDLDSLADFHEYCAANGLEYNGVISRRQSVFETIRDVAAAAMSFPALIDGKWSVITDKAQATPVSFITPRNSFGFSMEKFFVDTPHAWRIAFANEDEGWRQDESRVYNNGYDETNATKFETIEFPGVTNSTQIQRLGRYQVISGAQRPERWVFNQDMEYITYQRGDRVAITHDVLLIGQKAGRIKSVTVTGGNAVTHVELDEEVLMETGTTYAIAIRTPNDALITRTVITNDGVQTTLQLTSNIAAVAGQPAVAKGDIFGFGISGLETDNALILSIKPSNDFTAEITAVPYRTEVYDTQSEGIPAFNTKITQLPSIPIPEITQVISDERVLLLGPGQSLITRVAISFNPLGGEVFNGIRVDAQVRSSATGGPFYNAEIDAINQGQVLIRGLQQGLTFDFRIRFSVNGRQPGAWAYFNGHRVVGKSTVPDGLNGMTLSVFGGQAYIRWNQPSELDVLFGGQVRFRHSDAFTGVTWSNSVSIGDAANARGLLATLPLKPGTYLARVYDIDNNGSNEISMITTKQASIHPFGSLGTIDEDPTFAGVKDDVIVSGGFLQIDDDGAGGILTSGIYDFDNEFDFGSVTKVRLTVRIGAEVTLTGTTIDDRSEPIDSWDDFDGTADTSGNGDCKVYERHTDDDPATSGAEWSEWQRLDSAEFEARGFQFQARLTSDDIAYNILISDLGINADEINMGGT